jgi:hypothetical protein
MLTAKQQRVILKLQFLMFFVTEFQPPDAAFSHDWQVGFTV